MERSEDPTAILLLSTICAHEFAHALVRASGEALSPKELKKGMACVDPGYLVERMLFGDLLLLHRGSSSLETSQRKT